MNRLEEREALILLLQLQYTTKESFGDVLTSHIMFDLMANVNQTISVKEKNFAESLFNPAE